VRMIAEQAVDFTKESKGGGRVEWGWPAAGGTPPHSPLDDGTAPPHSPPD